MARMLVVRQAVKIVPSSVMLLGAAVTSLTLWQYFVSRSVQYAHRSNEI